VCGTVINRKSVSWKEGLIVVTQSREARHAKKVPFSVPQPSALDSTFNDNTSRYGYIRSPDATVLPESTAWPHHSFVAWNSFGPLALPPLCPIANTVACMVKGYVV
jgi:hypothetical protein